MARYEWKVDKAGNRRFVRNYDDAIVAKVKHTGRPKAGEMAIEPPDGSVVAKVDVAEPVVVETTEAPTPVTSTATVKKAPAKRRAPAKKSNG